MVQVIAANIVACQGTGVLPRQQACPCKLQIRQSPYSRSRCNHVPATNQQHSAFGSKHTVASRTVPILLGQSVKRRITCSVSAQQRQVCSAQLHIWFAAEACNYFVRVGSSTAGADNAGENNKAAWYCY